MRRVVEMLSMVGLLVSTAGCCHTAGICDCTVRDRCGPTCYDCQSWSQLPPSPMQPVVHTMPKVAAEAPAQPMPKAEEK